MFVIVLSPYSYLNMMLEDVFMNCMSPGSKLT